MADSWEPRQSPVRRLKRAQDSMNPGSMGGRLRQAAPVPLPDLYEPPPFNMHVEATPPDDIYLGRMWMDMSEFEAAEAGPQNHQLYTPYYGPKRHLAWDGESQHAFESQTNNPRYYAAQTIKGSAPIATSGFGTPGNTDGQYNSESGFPRSGAVPLVNVESAVYYLAMYGMVGSAATRLNRQAYPSQTFSSNGFLRAFCVWPDQPEILAFGWAGTSYNAWKATVDSSNVLGAWTDLGAVTYVNRIGTSIRPTIAISDRLGYFPSSPTIVDRIGPTVRDVSAQLLALIGGGETIIDYNANARIKPGRLLIQHRSGSFPSFSFKVSEFQVNSPTDISLVSTFTAPSTTGSNGLVFGYSLLGKLVVFSMSTGGVWSGFYDGVEFACPNLGPTGYGFCTATKPEGYTGGDAWLAGSGYAGDTYMTLFETIDPKGILKVWTTSGWLVA